VYPSLPSRFLAFMAARCTPPRPSSKRRRINASSGWDSHAAIRRKAGRQSAFRISHHAGDGLITGDDSVEVEPIAKRANRW
jgi:hypothetical protein